MAIFGLYLLVGLFLVSVVWACLPIRSPHRLLVALLTQMGATALGFIWLLNLLYQGGGPLPYVTFGPGFVIATFRVLVMTTDWGERLTARLRHRQEPR